LRQGSTRLRLIKRRPTECHQESSRRARIRSSAVTPLLSPWASLRLTSRMLGLRWNAPLLARSLRLTADTTRLRPIRHRPTECHQESSRPARIHSLAVQALGLPRRLSPCSSQQLLRRPAARSLRLTADTTRLRPIRHRQTECHQESSRLARIRSSPMPARSLPPRLLPCRRNQLLRRPLARPLPLTAATTRLRPIRHRPTECHQESSRRARIRSSIDCEYVYVTVCGVHEPISQMAAVALAAEFILGDAPCSQFSCRVRRYLLFLRVSAT